jgi:hypothetical protein
MIRTTIIAGGLLGLGIFTAAPAMAVEGMQVDCSNPCVIVPGLVQYYTGLGSPILDANGKPVPTAAQEFTTAWTQGPGQAVNAWATGPATVAKVWSDALVNGGGTLALGPAAPAPPA